MDAGITLTGIQYGVQGKTILHGIDLSLTEARIGIVGRNGSGKTTLLRIMAGLLEPIAGRVTVAGTAATDRKAMIAALGILFQNPDHQIIFPTVDEELAFGLRQLGRSAQDARAEVLALLTREGRAHWAQALVSNLSQGQKQWLCLQAILLMKPATLLLDEPFAALDLPTQARLQRRLATLPQRIVTISHDPAAVAQCDRVIWLEGGAVAADGPPATVLPAFRAEMARIGEADADTDLAG